MMLLDLSKHPLLTLGGGGLVGYVNGTHHPIQNLFLGGETEAKVNILTPLFEWQVKRWQRPSPPLPAPLRTEPPSSQQPSAASVF